MRETIEPSIVVSGPAWIGEGTRSLDSSFRELIEQSVSEVHIVMYTATSSSLPMLDMLEPKLRVGVNATIVLNRISDLKQEHVVSRLNDFAERFPRSKFYSFEPRYKTRNLHAKAIVSDRSDAIVGSANLSLRGLLENYELGIRVKGTIARGVSTLIDRLSRDSECVPLPVDFH